jgi:homoserine kinase
MKKEIRIFAPASVTNVSCGFDIMGFAIDSPGDELILRLTDNKGIKISKITGDDGKLPSDLYKNTAGLSLLSLANHLNIKDGIEIEIHKKMKLGTGLGSSAASAVGSVYALNELLGKPLSKTELLPFALEGEKLTSGGTPHADNVSACLFGGFVVVRSVNPLDVVSIDIPDNLFCTIIYPHIEINTADTRRILKKQILLSDAVKQWGNIAGLVAGLMKNDYELIGRSLHDEIIEPVRSVLIPGFDDIKKESLKAGALGCSISGSGPSMFAFSSSRPAAEKVGKAMESVLDELGVENSIFISRINKEGPKVLQSVPECNEGIPGKFK